VTSEISQTPQTTGRSGTAALAPEGPPHTRPPETRLSPVDWARVNLFSPWYNTLLTVVFGGVMVWVLFRALRFVFFTGRWEIIQVNLTNFMIGRFPRDELYRPWIAIMLVALVAGITLGRSARRGTLDLRGALKRAGPLVALLVVLLSFTRTLTPGLLTAAAIAVAGAGWWVGARLPERFDRRLPLVWLATVLAVFLAFTGFGGVGWDNWGGLLLTLFLAIGGIVLSFPIGVLLALGRRSSFPAVRMACVGYIELIRGVPLITLLFMSALALGFFLPQWVPTPGLAMRAMIAFILFTAAYIAEIVRGGLQGVPSGQTEAAQALGLSPVKVTALIVLPQALRNVIPAIVGQFISLFKDTSLVFIIGLLELLQVAQTVTAQPTFRGQGLQPETLLFASFIFWAFCYSMSRASQRLEQRLGVGVR
jgi:general L-amino acid transport system permease protein